MTLHQLGLGIPQSWLATLAWSLAWLAVMLAYSPLADRIATRLVRKPPTLGAFRGLQQSTAKLLIGIVIAWLLGAFVEEIIFRGMVLRYAAEALALWIPRPAAVAAAVCLAAGGAGVLHFYQGLRAVLIVTQLSVLFGLLFVLSGYNLWAVVLCHGFYDTIAFIRFAQRKSKYSQLTPEPSGLG